MKRQGLAVGFALLLAACQSAQPAPHGLVSGESTPPGPDEAHAGTLAFAQAACGGCHAVARNALSPNPQSPPFAEIANREGLTRQSLATWLRDAHNYPEDMDFDLYEAQIDALADYIITLRDPDYRPPAT